MYAIIYSKYPKKNKQVIKWKVLRLSIIIQN